MRVYRLTMLFDANSDTVYQVPVHAEGEEWPEAIYGAAPVSAGWKPIRLELEAREERRPAGDFTMVSCSVPALSERAAVDLDEVLSSHAQLLPLQGPGPQKWYALNVHRLASGLLDLKNCETSKYEDGSIMAIWQYAFLKERAGELPPIFKLAEMPRGEILVTDALVQQVRRHELIGFGFELVWNG